MGEGVELKGLTRTLGKGLELHTRVHAYHREASLHVQRAREVLAVRTRINIQTPNWRVRELVQLGFLERLEEDARGRTRARFCIRRYLYQRFLGGDP